MSDLKQTSALTPAGNGSNPVSDELARRIEREAPVHELPGKKFIVTVEVFDLTDDDKPGKHVPADAMVKLIEKEIMLSATKSVTDEMLLRVCRADFKTPVLEARAKVEVRATAPQGMFVHGNDVAQFLFQLRDDIIEIIEDLKPPKRAWVAIGKGQAQTKGVPKDDRHAGSSSGGSPDPDRPSKRRTRTNAKRRRTGSRPRPGKQSASTN